MKSKYALFVCSLLLAIALGGCGMSPAADPVDDAQKTPIEDNSQGENEADQAKAKAILAYQEILKAAPAIEGEHAELEDASFGYDENMEMFGSHYDRFAIFDIDQDGVPELITLSVINFRWTPVSVYTFADGKTVLLKDPKDMEAHGTFEQCSIVNGSYDTYICSENHIHSVWSGNNPMDEAVEENNAYVFDGTALTATDCTGGENESRVYFSDIAKANTPENVDALA